MKTVSSSTIVATLLLCLLVLPRSSVVEGRVGRKISSSREGSNTHEHQSYGPVYHAVGKRIVRGQQELASLDAASSNGDYDEQEEDEEEEETPDLSLVGEDHDDDDEVNAGSKTTRRSKERGSRVKKSASASSFVTSSAGSATTTGATAVERRRRLMMSKSSMSSSSRNQGGGGGGGMMNMMNMMNNLNNFNMAPRQPVGGLVTPGGMMRNRMPSATTFPTTLATAPTAAPTKGSPTILSAPSSKPTSAGPTVLTTTAMPTTAAPVAARTRPPRQPRRMRRRMRRNNRGMMGMSGRGNNNNARQGNGGQSRLVVQGTLDYFFIPGTGMNPTRQEINAVVDETEEFYMDTFESRRLTRNAPVTDFRMNNLAVQYAPGGDLDRFRLQFQGVAFVPRNSFVNSDDIARIMANANYPAYLQFYVWEADPFTQNIFFQTNSVSFRGQGVFFFT